MTGDQKKAMGYRSVWGEFVKIGDKDVFGERAERAADEMVREKGE
jgi:hypothetical protein